MEAAIAGDLFHFAGADERGGIGPRTALEHLGDHLPAGAQQQLAKLGERFLGIETLRLTRGVCRTLWVRGRLE